MRTVALDCSVPLGYFLRQFLHLLHETYKRIVYEKIMFNAMLDTIFHNIANSVYTYLRDNWMLSIMTIEISKGQLGCQQRTGVGEQISGLSVWK
jgi:hypothetical protein